ncbi:MAG: polymerase sigma factor SigA [Planctomycetota bacterium]|jgi:RNA polymerase primary sigma factor
MPTIRRASALDRQRLSSAPAVAASASRVESKPVVRPTPAARAKPAAVIAQAMDLLAEPIDFMDHPDFRKAGAERRIFDLAPPVPRPTVQWYRPMMDEIGQAQPRRYEGILLTAAQERVIFMQFNYAKYRMRRIQKALRGGTPDAAQARELLRWNDTASRLRDQIAETNLALVLAMAKRVRLGEGDYPDLIGEGNMALMRSVDKFDCARGFKFSTYACRAILKAFSRHGLKLAKHRQRFPVEFDPALEEGNRAESARVENERQDVAEVRAIVEGNTAELSEVERAVVMHRFALDGADHGRQPTLAQVGRLVGLTKERVRQIQNSALAKIRRALEGSTGGLHPMDPGITAVN